LNLSLDDIKKAVNQGGDVSTFADLYFRILGSPPVSNAALSDEVLALPDPLTFIQYDNPAFAEALRGVAGSEEYSFSPGSDLMLAAVPSSGRFTGKCVRNFLKEFSPDLLILSTRPPCFSSAMLYAFGLRCALGLPFHTEIMYKSSGQNYSIESFHPGSMEESALIESWLTKVPLMPAGHPGRPIQPEIYADYGYLCNGYFWSRWLESLEKANLSLDSALGEQATLEEAAALSVSLGSNLMESIGGELDISLRNSIKSDSGYIASRIVDAVSTAKRFKKNPRILVLMDITYYSDTLYHLELLKSGGGTSVYSPLSGKYEVHDMLLAVRKREEKKKTSGETPFLTSAEKIFNAGFDEYLENKNKEKLSEQDVHRLVAGISGRLRAHPEIARGASVRGAIAFEDLIKGYAEIEGSITLRSVQKASMTALPPRLVLKLKGDEKAIVRDIVNEVLYDFRFSSQKDEDPGRDSRSGSLSTDEILESLEEIGPLPGENEPRQKKPEKPAVLSDKKSDARVLKELEEMEFIKQNREGGFTLTEKALEYMLDMLERKFKAGEITQQEYETKKAGIKSLLKDLSDPKFSEKPSREQATTIMEMMDAQDRGWNNGVNFNLMHLYYHVKDSSGSSGISPQKRDYYALGRLIDEMLEKNLLRKSENGQGLLLTGIALDALYKYLVEDHRKKPGIQGITGSGKDFTSERKQETRRYSAGDPFREISMRHTLKEIARQKRNLNQIRKNDFRVFLREKRRAQSDIVVCIDTSGSMGFHHEFTYARLAAAGIVHASIRNRDRIGMVAFNDCGQLCVPLTEKDEQKLLDSIACLSVRGNTNIGDGIKCAGELLYRDRPHNHKYIVLITDGQPTALSEKIFRRLQGLEGKALTEESAVLETRQAADRGAVVSVIHIAGKGAGRAGSSQPAAGQNASEFIQNLARTGKGKVRRIGSKDDLKAVLYS